MGHYEPPLGLNPLLASEQEATFEWSHPDAENGEGNQFGGCQWCLECGMPHRDANYVATADGVSTCGDCWDAYLGMTIIVVHDRLRASLHARPTHPDAHVCACGRGLLAGPWFAVEQTARQTPYCKSCCLAYWGVSDSEWKVTVIGDALAAPTKTARGIRCAEGRTLSKLPSQSSPSLQTCSTECMHDRISSYDVMRSLSSGTDRNPSSGVNSLSLRVEESLLTSDDTRSLSSGLERSTPHRAVNPPHRDQKSRMSDQNSWETAGALDTWHETQPEFPLKKWEDSGSTLTKASDKRPCSEALGALDAKGDTAIVDCGATKKARHTWDTPDSSVELQ